MKQRLLMLTLGLVAATLVVLTAASSAQDTTRATRPALEQADRLGEELEQVAPASVEFIEFICRRQVGALTRALALGKTVAVPLTCAGDPDPVWALVDAESAGLLQDGALNLDWEVTER